MAIMLQDISAEWQMNVLLIPGLPTIVKVKVDGYGEIDAQTILLSKDDARHLACQITELLGREDRNQAACPDAPWVGRAGEP